MAVSYGGPPNGLFQLAMIFGNFVNCRAPKRQHYRRKCSPGRPPRWGFSYGARLNGSRLLEIPFLPSTKIPSPGRAGTAFRLHGLRLLDTATVSSGDTPNRGFRSSDKKGALAGVMVGAVLGPPSARSMKTAIRPSDARAVFSADGRTADRRRRCRERPPLDLRVVPREPNSISVFGCVSLIFL